MLRRTLLAACAALTVASSALAAAPKPFVSASDKQHVEDSLGFFGQTDLAFFPAQGPKYYSLVTNNASTSQIILTFADRRYAHEAPAVGRSHALIYTVARYHGTLATCGGAGHTMTAAGKHVYWNGTTAWQCFKRHGRLVKVSAYGPFLSKQQLGTVIATTKPATP